MVCVTWTAASNGQTLKTEICNTERERERDCFLRRGCLSVRPSTLNKSASTGWIFIKSDIVSFCENLRWKFIFDKTLTIIIIIIIIIITTTMMIIIIMMMMMQLQRS